MSSVRSAESRRKGPTSESLARREYAHFLEELEIDSMLTNQTPFDLGDLSDLQSGSYSSALDDMFAEPLSAQDQYGSDLIALKSLGVADAVHVASSVRKARPSRIRRAARADTTTVDLPMATFEDAVSVFGVTGVRAPSRSGETSRLRELSEQAFLEYGASGALDLSIDE